MYQVVRSDDRAVVAGLMSVNSRMREVDEFVYVTERMQVKTCTRQVARNRIDG